MKKVEVVILSGFLGAGKTTLLQQVLEHEQKQNRKVGVVMNEVGEVSIDSNAVPEETPLQELLNGCVCCTLSDKLEVKLYELIHKHDLDVIYLETTGVAHPVEVLDACLSPLLAEKLRIRAIITLLDALTWKGRDTFSVQLRQLITEQVKHADIVVMNKIDCINEETQQEIEAELRSLNAHGMIVPTSFAEVNVHELMPNERKKSSEHTPVHAADHLHIKTFVHTFSRPVSQEAFEDFLRAMPDSIYRVKGYIRFRPEEETLLFQYSYGMSSYTDEAMKMKNTLVFIGDNLDHDALRKALTEIEGRETS